MIVVISTIGGRVSTMSIENILSENRAFSASPEFKKNANFNDAAIYEEAKKNRLGFWEKQAQELVWFKPWETTLEWKRPNAKWFVGGTLNACYNCLDRFLGTPTESKNAIIWEGEEGEVRKYTYKQAHREVCKLANVLTNMLNVKKGDRVTLYMPMIPELAFAVLACARIGAVHSVVFGGFSANSLKDRLQDSGSKVLITANAGWRRGKKIPLKEIVEDALKDGDTSVEHTLVVNHVKDLKTPKNSMDVDYHKIMSLASLTHNAVQMDSEDILFILYTSGTTGKPKGIIHTTGGYMTHARYSTRAVFDLKDDDIYWCTADIGWITGHTYLVYGPLANGATTVMFEGTPDYPEKNRFWDVVEKHKVSIFYTAPTAIRSFMKWGLEHVKEKDLSTLRLLGTVGEPINPEAWMWYHEHIGGKNCPIVDTWWQTETGGIMISNLLGINDMKPGKAGLTLPGIEAKILNQDGSEVTQGGGLLSLTEPWPSMLRGIWGDEQRFKDTYWANFDTYFAGDGAVVDEDGYFMVLGRVDDVLNVAGHRIGTMEVESALVECDTVCEAAVVGMPDDIKGQAIVAFVILEEGVSPTEDTEKELIKLVAANIGAIAKPKRIIFVPDLPKTRSGKIMRRILKNIVEGKESGETTTLGNPEIVVEIQTRFTD